MSRGGEPTGSRGRSRRSTIMGIALLIALVLIVIAVVWGIQRWTEEDLDGPAVVAPTETPAEVAAVTPADTAGQAIGEVLADPEDQTGETIFVNGVVVEVVSSTAYIIGEVDPEVQGDERLLVIGPPPPITSGEIDDELDYPQDTIEVSGTLHEYDEGDITDHVDASEIGDVAGQYYLVAEGAAVTVAPPGPGEIVEVDQLTENHEDYLGDIVRVTGTIAEVMSGDVFTLEGGLLVIEATGRIRESALVEGGEIRVGGPVRSIGDNLEDEYGVSFEGAEQRAEGDSILVATSIHILPAQNAN
jgi:hypothetical protein